MQFNLIRTLSNYLLLLLLFFLAQNSSAQNFAIIGNGTTSNTTNFFPAPYGNIWQGVRHQFLIRASELTANGIPANAVIGSLGFNVTATNNSSPLAGWNVKIYTTTTANPLASGWQTSGLVAVSTPVTLNIVTGWIQTSFDNAFLWNGTDNLVIETCFNNTSTSSNASVQRTTSGLTSGFTYSRWVRGNSMVVCSDTTTVGVSVGTSTSIRPNIRLGYLSNSCSGLPTAGTAVISNSNPCPGTLNNLTLSGTSLGNGMSVAWQTSSSATGPWTNIPGATNLNYFFTAITSQFNRAAISCGSNTSYTNAVSMTTTSYLPGGTYTINNTLPTNISTGGTNFNSFSAFATAIANSISGPIVVNVAPGTYNESFTLSIGNTCGTSPTNTITINGNGATLSYVSTNPNQRAAITINGSDFITINNLNINGYSNSPNNYAYGILLTNDADYVTINGCNINLDSNSTSNGYAGIVVAGSTTNPFADNSACDYGTITNNIINGGAYGITLIGQNSTNGLLNGWTISNNEIRNSGVYGIYASAINSPLISKNTLHRSGRTNADNYRALVFDNGCLYLRVLKNKIHTPSSSTSNAEFYGISVLNCPASNSFKHDISNNLLYNLIGLGNHFYLFNQFSGNTNFYHNTIVSQNTSTIAIGTTTAIYHEQLNSSSNIYYYNNNIVITRSSSNIKMGINVVNGTSRIDCNNNNIYLNGQGYNYTGKYLSVYYKSIFEWMSGTNLDGLSVGLDPFFVSPSTGNFKPTNPNMDDIGSIRGITTDILDLSRSSTTPDIGAYEFTATSCSGTQAAGNAIADVTSACTGGPVVLSLSNMPLYSGTTITWQSKPSTGSIWTAIANSSPTNYMSFYKATMPSVATDFRAVVTCSGNISYSTPVSITNQPFYMCYCSPFTGTTIHTNSSNIITNITVINTPINTNSFDGFGNGGYTRNEPSFANNTGTLAKTYTYTINATLNATNYGVGLWIDYNQNGSFDVSEYSPMTVNGSNATTSITVPNTATSGLTGIRFRAYYNTITGSNACTNVANIQETEDYVVNIVAPQPCSGAAATGTAFAPSNVCPTIAFTLTDTAYAIGTGLSFNWQQFNSSTNSWVNIPGATNPVYNVTSGIATPTQFRFSVLCNNTSTYSYSNSITVGLSPAATCYCTSDLYNSAGGCADNDYIKSFSTWGSTTNNITNLSSNCNNTTTGYTYFNGMSHVAKQVDTVKWALVNTPYDYEAYKIWVDFNNNGSFNDPGEKVYESLTVLNPSDVDSGFFVIPYNATVGNTRIRLRCVYGTTNFTTCSNHYYGETEDYNLQIQQNNNICTGAPNVVISSPSTLFCPDTTVLLTGSTGNNFYYQYQWQSSPSGANTWTSIPDDSLNSSTTNVYAAGGFLGNVDFRLLATCPYTPSGATGISNVLTISQANVNDFIPQDTIQTYGSSYVLNAGSGFLSYSWNNGAQTQSTTVTSSGWYKCTVSLGLCTGMDSVFVNFNSGPICNVSVNAGNDVVVCAGNSVTLNANSNGTVSWNNGISNGVSFIPTSSGQYIVTATTGATCFAYDTVNVTVNALPNVGAGSNQTVCAGQSVTLNGTGATTYTWNNGVSNGVSFVPTATQTYTVTGTNTTTGCSNTANVTVDVVSAPPVFAGADINVCTGGSVTLNAISPATVTWSGGITNNQPFTPSLTGYYIATASLGAGCSNTDTVLVTVLSLPNVNAGNDTSICAGAAIVLNGIGANTYSWNNGVTNGIAFQPATTTTYTVTGNDNNGCSNTDQITITVNVLPTVDAGNNLTVCPGTSITLLGSGANSYSWNNGVLDGVSFIPTSSTTYTVTGTDLNGCSNSDDVTVTVNANANIINAGNDVTVCAGSSVTLNATSASPFLWTGGITNNQPFVPTSSGFYVAYTTNPSGCNGMDTVYVTVLPGTPVNAGNDVAVCAGNSVTLTASGASSFQWSGGVQNGVSFVPTATQYYVVSSNDANACATPDTVLVTVNPLPFASAGGNKLICPGGNVDLIASVGSSYLWSNGATTPSINVVQAGNYSVTITDANGCSATSAPAVVSVKALPSSIKIKTIGATSVCEPNTVPFVIDLAPGVTAGFSYQWNLNGSPIIGANDSVFVGENTGAYSLTVSGGATCSKTSSGKSITIKPLPVATFTASGPTTFCAGGQVTLVAPTITGVTYSWLRDGISAGSGVSKSFKIAGSYTVIATQSGCKDTSNTYVTVIVNPLPIATITAVDTTTFCAGDSATLLASPTGIGYNYQWMMGTTQMAATTSPTFEANTAGTYKVIVTDNNSCISKASTTSVKIKVNPIPVASISASTSTTIAANGSVKLNASPSTGVTFQWFLNGNPISGATTKSYIATTGGSYTVAITKTGCTGTSAATTVTQIGVKEEAGITSNPTATEEAVFELAAYPNPVSGVLTINVRGIEEVNATVQVMDFNGRVVAMKEMTTSSTTIDMTGYASGMYLIRYKDAEGRTGTIKINKQ